MAVNIVVPGRSVLPQSAGPALGSAQAASLDAFGGDARGMIQAGQEIQQRADAYAQEALRLQQEENETSAKTLDIMLANETRDILYGTVGEDGTRSGGYFNALGENAKNEYGATVKALDEARERIRAQAPNARVAEAFDRAAGARRETAQNSIAAHRRTEDGKAFIATAEARIAAAVDDGALAILNPDARADSVRIMVSEVNAVAERMGWSGVQRDEALEKGFNEMFGRGFKAVFAVDPARAIGLFEGNLERFSPEQRKLFNEQIRDYTTTTTAQNLVNSVVGEHGTGTEGYKALLAAADNPHVLAAALPDFAQRGNILSALETREQKEELAKFEAGFTKKAPDIFRGAKTYEEVVSTVYRVLGPDAEPWQYIEAIRIGDSTRLNRVRDTKAAADDGGERAFEVGKIVTDNVFRLVEEFGGDQSLILKAFRDRFGLTGDELKKPLPLLNVLAPKNGASKLTPELFSAFREAFAAADGDALAALNNVLDANEDAPVQQRQALTTLAKNFASLGASSAATTSRREKRDFDKEASNIVKDATTKAGSIPGARDLISKGGYTPSQEHTLNRLLDIRQGVADAEAKAEADKRERTLGQTAEQIFNEAGNLRDAEAAIRAMEISREERNELLSLVGGIDAALQEEFKRIQDAAATEEEKKRGQLAMRIYDEAGGDIEKAKAAIFAMDISDEARRKLISYVDGFDSAVRTVAGDKAKAEADKRERTLGQTAEQIFNEAGNLRDAEAAIRAMEITTEERNELLSLVGDIDAALQDEFKRIQDAAATEEEKNRGKLAMRIYDEAGKDIEKAKAAIFAMDISDEARRKLISYVDGFDSAVRTVAGDKAKAEAVEENKRKEREELEKQTQAVTIASSMFKELKSPEELRAKVDELYAEDPVLRGHILKEIEGLEKVRNDERKRAVDALVNRVWNAATLDEAEALANSAPEDMREVAVSEFRKRQKEEERDEERAFNSSLEVVLREIAEGREPWQTNPEAAQIAYGTEAGRKAIFAAKKNALEGRLYAATSDGETLFNLRKLPDEALSAVNPIQYRAQLTQEEFDRLSNFVIAAQHRARPDPQATDRAEKAAFAMTPKLAKEYFKNKRSSKGRANENAIAFMRRLDSWIIERKMATGEIPTEQEIRTEGQRLIMNSGGWFSSAEYEEATPIFAPDGNFTPEFAEEIAEAARDLGVTVDEDGMTYLRNVAGKMGREGVFEVLEFNARGAGDQ